MRLQVASVGEHGSALIATDRELVSVELPVVNIARENGVMPALPSARFNGPTQPYGDQRRATRDAGGNELKAIGLTQFDGPEVLEVVELPEPQPGRGEVGSMFTSAQRLHGFRGDC